MERESISQSEKQTPKPKQIEPVLSDTGVRKHLEELYLKFVIVTIDKASNNFVFLYRKSYISELLAEVSPYKNGNSTSAHSLTQKSYEVLPETKVKYCKMLDRKKAEPDINLPIICWLPKVHRTPTYARFIVASKSDSTKRLYDMFSKVSK